VKAETQGIVALALAFKQVILKAREDSRSIREYFTLFDKAFKLLIGNQT
jgi:hypothetical protein